jgi:hypothetical protein
MKFPGNTTTIITFFLLASAVLYATGSLQKINYKPVNDRDGEMRDSRADVVSVHDNATFAVKLPEEISFAGEVVPMDVMDVRERLDRELTVNSYWHSSTILMMKRANRWFPVIEQILAEYNVPDDFKYVAMAESGFQQVTSSKGATGYWQFMKSAAQEQGLQINSEIDERYHVEKATHAACRHLIKLHDDFGTWTMAAAAYNVGQAGLRKQVDRQQQTGYYDLLLNEETSRYVFRLIALKAIHTAPADFGFLLEETDLYQPYEYRTVAIDGPVESWPAFCAANDITYRELKLLNPWLRDAHLSNTSGRQYEIKVMSK